MKAISFIINTNIFIALAAVSLTFASQVQLGLHPEFHAYIFLIFFATLLDYTLHRFLAVYKNPNAAKIEKYHWASIHLTILKSVLIISLAGILATSVLVKPEILFLLILLAFISGIYSLAGVKNNYFKSKIRRITGLKTVLIALVWSAVTVLVPAIQSANNFINRDVWIVFAERFTFIFAIAIPFDIRDLAIDAQSQFKTIPEVVGERNALKISGFALLLSLLIALTYYLCSGMLFILPAYFLSIICTFIFINSKALKKLNFYYHGILDGSILLHGVLILLCFYVQF